METIAVVECVEPLRYRLKFSLHRHHIKCVHIFISFFSFHAHLSFVWSNFMAIHLTSTENSKKKADTEEIFRSFSISFALTIWHSPYLQVHYVHEINKRTCMHFTLGTITFISFLISSLFICSNADQLLFYSNARTLTLI